MQSIASFFQNISVLFYVLFNQQVGGGRKIVVNFRTNLKNFYYCDFLESTAFLSSSSSSLDASE